MNPLLPTTSQEHYQLPVPSIALFAFRTISIFASWTGLAIILLFNHLQIFAPVPTGVLLVLLIIFAVNTKKHRQTAWRFKFANGFVIISTIAGETSVPLTAIVSLEEIGIARKKYQILTREQGQFYFSKNFVNCSHLVHQLKSHLSSSFASSEQVFVQSQFASILNKGIFLWSAAAMTASATILFSIACHSTLVVDSSTLTVAILLVFFISGTFSGLYIATKANAVRLSENRLEIECLFSTSTFAWSEVKYLGSFFQFSAIRAGRKVIFLTHELSEWEKLNYLLTQKTETLRLQHIDK